MSSVLLNFTIAVGKEPWLFKSEAFAAIMWGFFPPRRKCVHLAISRNHK